MLLIPAMAMLLSQLLVVVLVRKDLFKLEITRVAVSSNETSTLDTVGTLRSIAKDASKMGVIMLSYQLLTNGFVLVLSKNLTHQEIGSYGLTMQLISVVMSLSMIWSQSNFFQMAATRQSGDNLALRKIFFNGFSRAMGVASLGILGLFILASPLLEILGSKTLLLQPILLTVVLGAAWIEFSLTQFSQLLIAMGDMRVAYLSLLTAVTICVSTIFLLSGGYSLFVVFIIRIISFCFFIGIPVLIISNKILRVSQP
jgi:O-antigen/teichoic acid export membrane protein